MYFGPHSYEFYLLRYAEIYQLVGKLEYLLRIKVVTTLSNFCEEFGYKYWYELVPKTTRNIEAIRTAIQMSEGRNMESYLPFSFWRHLFRRENFAGLWVPILHLAFPGIQNPNLKTNFNLACRNMKRANNIRNRVAHFNLANAGNHEEEVSVLNWLINAMGGPSA
jgi:hypothetical protein